MYVDRADHRRPVLVITPTYDRPHRIAYLERCLSCFRAIADLFWIVVEDAAQPDPAVMELLAASRISHTYLAHGPTRRWGNAQRDVALRYIRDRALPGVVYLADDDNYYQPALFAELRKIRRVGILPVGLFGPRGIERPLVKRGRIVGWSAHWTERRFPIDMAGFGFDAALLLKIDGPIWTYAARGGESEFLARIVNTQDDLEILCDGCRCCYVWHDLPLNQSPARALVAYRWRRFRILIRRHVIRPLRTEKRDREAGRST
jgi:galactosylgalactosylxylosylprotein 3-beta-glucuronosyltransferase 3